MAAATVLAMLFAAPPVPAAAYAAAGPQDEREAPHGALGLEEAAESVVPGRYVVVLKDSIDHPGAVARAQVSERGGKLGFVYRLAIKGYSAKLDSDAVRAVERDPRVEYVEPVRRTELSAQTTPTGVQRIFATQNAALDIDAIDDVRIDADVAVIDSGIDYQHPDLNVAGRTNCVPPEESGTPVCVDNTGTDGYWHGTHVAGTVGALDNGDGVVGVAPGARLWAVRIFTDKGVGYTDWTIAGVEWVTQRAATIEVANMSLAGPGVSTAENEAIAASVGKGVVYAVAAGNESSNAAGFHPANGPDAITVSALADYDGQPGGKVGVTCVNRGLDDTAATFSNWGQDVDIAAPGVCINSTLPGGKYGSSWGTSMATPHVAGAAAVLAAQANPQTKADVESIRKQLIDGGALDWSDTSEDRKPEPLLYLDDALRTATEAATGGWSGAGGGTVELSGAINPRGLETEYRFEYGTTTAYGQSAPASPAKLAPNAGYTQVSTTIGGLKADQTYHYRLAATNSGGTVYGRDMTFIPSRWAVRTPATQPTMTHNSWLEDVSCPSANHCMAVGFYYNNNGTQALAYEGSGDNWSWRSVPAPSGGGSPFQLEGVSCSAADACTAVGRMWGSTSNRFEPYAVRWNGAAWSAQSVPSPTGSTYANFSEVSCPTSSHCLAVGYYRNAAGVWVNYSARWQGGSWEQLTTPNPADIGSQSLLEGVDCVSSSYCVAVGGYYSAAGPEKRLIMKWDGSSWSFQAPDTTGNGTRFRSVSCTSAEFCMAVGPVPLAQAWDGSKWTTRASALPAGAGSAWLFGVECTSPAHCVAAGNAWRDPHSHALVERWNGAAWAVHPGPRDAERDTRLFGVSCVRLAGCAAAGGSGGASWTPLLMQRTDLATGEATSIAATSATLNGSLNPGGVSTSYYFEYGPTTAYGVKAPASPAAAGSGGDHVDVSRALTGLQPETVYHYRLVASDASGTSYGADRTFRSGAVTPVYEGSIGSSGSGLGQLNGPWGIDADSKGNFWVADAYNHRVQKFTPAGVMVDWIGGYGTGNGQFIEPLDVALDSSNNVWVTDSGNGRVQKFDAAGNYLGQLGTYGVGKGQFVEPWGIDIAANGDVWVTDARFHRVEQFTSAGTLIREIGAGGYGSGPGEFESPKGLAIDNDGDVWVVDSKLNRVQEFSATGTYLGGFGSGGTAAGQFDEAQAIVVKPSGELLVTDRWNGRVQQFTPEGEFRTQFGGGQLVEPRGIALGREGLLYVSNTWKDRVEKWK